jgi:hypothetical protein
MEVNNEIQALATLIHGKDHCYQLDKKLGGPRDELGAIAK